MSAVYSIYTSPNHAPIPSHLPTLIVTPHGNPSQVLYSFIHASYNRECFLLTPSPQGDLCVAKMVPPPGSRGPGGPGGMSDSSHSSDHNRDKSVRCEASRNLKWSITNTGIHAPVYKLTLPNPDSPGNEQPLFQISKPNPNATFWTMFYFTYAGHLIPPKRIEFGKIQKNAGVGNGGGGGTRVSITGKSSEEKAVWQTLGEGNEDMVEWIVLCAALNLLDEEIIKAAELSAGASTNAAANTAARSMPRLDTRSIPSSRPGGSPATSRGGPSPSPIQIRPTNGPAPQPFQRPPQNRMGSDQMLQQQIQQQQQRPQQSSNGYARPGPPLQGQGSSYQRPNPPQQQQGVPQGYPQQQNPYGARPPPPNGGMQQMSMPRPQPNGSQRGYYGPPSGVQPQQRGPPPAVGRQF
ncbi:hypothetical protein CBS101457_004574 [Exobasidium rhododendri]|nr:hypothetical protein CBS101457_004574 [Exobasidium rhododendri]